MRKVIFTQLILMVSVVSSFGQWLTNGSNLFYSGGNVGIGTDNPSYKLHINGELYLQPIDGNNGWNNSYLHWYGHSLIMGSPAGKWAHNSLDLKPGGCTQQSLYSQLRLYTALGPNQHELKILINSNEHSFFNAGNVGIGLTNPKTKLHVNGNTYVSNLSIGRSGSHYDEIGYNLGFTATNDVYTYKTRDHAASMRMGYNGTIEFRTAGVGNAGENITLYERMRINLNGNVGIGTTNPTAKLTVAGDILAREIVVEANAGADVVFEENYRLKSLQEVEQFITENKHLPDIAPADTMIRNGVNMGEFQIQLLQKIEELTLYVIKQEKKIDDLTNELKELKKEK
ncbi:MAG: hypothetical protein LBQ60_06240 [Bacteroidales bacterium]|jgi:hypothetical protein|nr:hypothetical protein [Bacteroidales bacterium]